MNNNQITKPIKVDLNNLGKLSYIYLDYFLGFEMETCLLGAKAKLLSPHSKYKNFGEAYSDYILKNLDVPRKTAEFLIPEPIK